MHKHLKVAIIGGGPAGLMAAEVISAAGYAVDVFDAMPSVGRKFLMAGKGGMNITHSEPRQQFEQRYHEANAHIAPWLDAFGADKLRSWMHDLGVDSFVGSSGRVFPTDMKAAPLLRAWLHRLRTADVSFNMRHKWLGWNSSGHLRFATPEGELTIAAEATLLALGGGSWAKLGSDGAWTNTLSAAGVSVNALKPSNCGFQVNWSSFISERFAGEPLKNVAISYQDASGQMQYKQGELLITQTGVEGSLIYAISALIREQIIANGSALVHLDLLPNKSLQEVLEATHHPRGARSISSHLQSRLGLKGLKAALLRELLDAESFKDANLLGHAIKALPLPLIATRPIDEAISTAGGIMFDELNTNLMLNKLPDVFCAGEMLDWEAPTGGYLLTACFSSGYVAGQGLVSWLKQTN